MWEEDQQEEDSRRRRRSTGRQHINASELQHFSSAQVCSTFHFQEWFIWLSQALIQIGLTAQLSLCSGSARLSLLMSQAKPILVMSPFVGSAWLKMAQLSWLSHFELMSHGITRPTHFTKHTTMN